MHTRLLLRARLGQTPLNQRVAVTATGAAAASSHHEPLLTRALRLQRHPFSVLLALGLGIALTSTPMHARVSQTREDADARREYQTHMSHWTLAMLREVDQEYEAVVAMRKRKFQEGRVSKERLDRTLAEDAQVWEAKRRDVEEARKEGQHKFDEWMRSRREVWAKRRVRVAWPVGVDGGTASV